MSDRTVIELAELETRVRAIVDDELYQIEGVVDHGGPHCDACIGIVIRLTLREAHAALREEGFDLYRPDGCQRLELVEVPIGVAGVTMVVETTGVVEGCHDEGPYWEADAGSYRLVPVEPSDE